MKEGLYSLLYRLGLHRAYSRHRRRNLTILCYHGVTADSSGGDPARPGFFVRESRFREHLSHLQDHYHVLPIPAALDRARPHRSVCLTFDDGHRNLLTLAAPALRRFGFPWSLYAVAEWVGSSPQRTAREWSPADDAEFLSWEDLTELQAEGVEIGGHTASHARLDGLSPEAARRELAVGRERLISHGLRAAGLAYPYGAYTDETPALAREVGYSYALTTDGRDNPPGADAWRLSRVLVGDDPLPTFSARVAGLSGALRLLARGRT